MHAHLMGTTAGKSLLGMLAWSVVFGTYATSD